MMKEIEQSMCRDNDHGGRRCPHDTSEARRIRRHKAQARAKYADVTATPATGAVSPVEAAVATPESTHSIDKVKSLKEEVAKLNADYADIVANPYGDWAQPGYELDGKTYTKAHEALIAIDEALERRIIEAGDQVVNLSVERSGVSETAVQELVRSELEEIVELKAKAENYKFTPEEEAEIARRRDKLESHKAEVEAFQNAHYDDYPHGGIDSFYGRLLNYTRYNKDDVQAKALYLEYSKLQDKQTSLTLALKEVENKAEMELTALKDRGRALLRSGGVAHPEVGKLLKSSAESYRAVLGEVREFGSRPHAFDKKSKKDKVAVLQRALDMYPSEWIEKSAAGSNLLVKYTGRRAHYSHLHPQKTKKADPLVQLVPKPIDWQPDPYNSQENGMFKVELDEDNEYSYTAPSGYKTIYSSYGAKGQSIWVSPRYNTFHAYKGEEPETSPGKGYEKFYYKTKNSLGEETIQHGWRRPLTKMRVIEVETKAELTIDTAREGFNDVSDGYSTALHEMAHRMEYTGGRVITRMEENFLKRRSTHDGQREPLKRIYPTGKAEYAYYDSFVNAYMGKIYERSTSKEILSMGMESLFAGTNGGLMGGSGAKSDPEMKRFILGLLATA
jgi:hypothetical protein